MADRSLFERLVRSRPGALTSQYDTQGAIDSVVRNLREIFNARQGCCATRPDYGMPSLGDLIFSFPMAIPEITRSVKTLVAEFEPRLRNVQVRHNAEADDMQALRFSIRAELVTDDDLMPLTLDGFVAGDGFVEVRT